MPTLKEIEQNLETVSTIKNIVEAYQEIANLKMNSVREKVLKNRKFFLEVSKVYQRTKNAYLFSKQKGWIKEKETTFLRPKKERVAVFLSANKFFYGPLILNIWKTIQEYSEKNKLELAVVGKMGKYLVEQSEIKTKSYYFQLEDEAPEAEEINKIIEFIKNYREILVFHGKYQTVLRQEAEISQISSGLPAPEKESKEIINYLFEPSAQAILKFFEKEIIATLFNQTILEHELARYASRMIAMYQATENAKNSKKELRLIKNKLEKQITNKKQIELFGGLIGSQKI